MKILQSKTTGTQTSFSTNFGGKLNFILYFQFTAATYIFTAPVYNYYNYSQMHLLNT
jgi:hypothetical protein